jgi:hypothetical protein
MTADDAFMYVNYAALAGWILLVAGVVLKNLRLAAFVAGRLVPVGLAVAYAAIAPSFFTTTQGGFDSLANLQIMFGDPWLVLGGWLHWLAADLFIGSWVAMQVMQKGWSRWWLAGLLPFCFAVGPVGFLAYHALAFARGGSPIFNGRNG